MKIVPYVIACVLLSACGAAPTRHEFDNTRTITASYDAVWDAVIAYFASNNISVKTIAKDSGVIYAEKALFTNDGAYADCGKPDMISKVLSDSEAFNVYVKRGDGKQVVSVNATFTEVRRTGITTDAPIVHMECTSTGRFEREFLQSIRI